MWLDTKDARSRDRNLSNFPSDLISDRSVHKRTTLAKGIFKVLCSNNCSSVRLFTFYIPYRLPECSILSKRFALRERRPKIPSAECSTPMGEGIYCHPHTYIHTYIYIYIYIYKHNNKISKEPEYLLL